MIRVHSTAVASRTWRPLRSVALVLLAGAIAGALAFAVSSYLLAKSYTSVATVLLNPGPAPSASSRSLFVDDQSVGKTFEELAGQPVVAGAAARRLGISLDAVTSHVALHSVPKTPLLEVQYTAGTRAGATLGASSYVDAFLDAIRRGQWLTADATLVSPATEPLHPSSPRTLLNTVMATMAGMVVAAGLLFQAASSRSRSTTAWSREDLAALRDSSSQLSRDPGQLSRPGSRSRR